LKDVLDEVLLRGILQCSFKLIKANVDELLGVHLYANISGCATRLLVSEAKVFRVVFLAVRHRKEGKHPHPLIKGVVNDRPALVFNLLFLLTAVSC
jgi:hypothetical protein